MKSRQERGLPSNKHAPQADRGFYQRDVSASRDGAGVTAAKLPDHGSLAPATLHGYGAGSMQQSALVFTVLAPLLLWVACHRCGTERFRKIIRRSLAVALLAFEAANFADKIATGQALDTALPMHLCDWGLVAVAGALWLHWQLGFELGYFWGLAGTIQALFTPAIDPANVWWRLFGFFFSHALIVVSVLHLLLTERYRPRAGALLRVIVCSEIYLAVTLLVNAATGGNYGFLSHRPAQATPLDYFSDIHWLYIAQLNVLALLLFAALYLPWWICGLRAMARSPTRRGGRSE